VRILTNAVLALSLAAGCQAQAITVFACEPEWASLTRTLLPEANVHTATTHLQDPHHIEARPSLIAQLRRADFAICTGAELEAGWLPMLQDRAGNPKVQLGRPAMFFAAEHVELIDPFKGTITPFSGDVHVHGNPHFHADPRRVLQVAKALALTLGNLFPEKKLLVDQNLNKFEFEMGDKILTWEKQSRALKGRTVITQHATFGYLWSWLGLKPVADLEPKPGMPPTANHLDKVLALAKTQQPIGIIVAQHHDPKPGRWLAGSMGMKSRLLILPGTVMDEQPGGIVRWFDQVVTQLSSLAK
jgi:zinc/manganese transport system substrate-binding protein